MIKICIVAYIIVSGSATYLLIRGGVKRNRHEEELYKRYEEERND